MSSASRKYSSLLVIGLKNEMAYRWDVLISSFMWLLYSVIGILVWVAVYSFSHTNSIMGLSLPTLIIYFIVIGALTPMLNWSSIVDIMADGIKGGSISRMLIRPMSYFGQLVIIDFSGSITNILMVSVPLLVGMAILTNMHVTLLLVSLFLLYIVIGYMIVSFMGFIVGSMAFYLTDVYGIAFSINYGIMIIGGGIVPLTFFPNSIGHLLVMLPFAFLAFVPAATYTGTISLATAVGLVPVGLAWTAILGIVAYILWKRMGKMINVVGV